MQRRKTREYVDRYVRYAVLVPQLWRCRVTCKKCGEIEFRTAHRTPWQRWLSLVVPVRPYQCLSCNHRQLRRIPPFFNTSRTVLVLLFGLILVSISTTFMLSTDRGLKQTAHDYLVVIKQLGKSGWVKKKSPEPSQKQVSNAALEKNVSTQLTLMASNKPPARPLPVSRPVVAHAIGDAPSAAANAVLDTSSPSSVVTQVVNNELKSGQRQPRSISLTMDTRKLAALLQPLPPSDENRGTASYHLDTIQVNRNHNGLTVELQGTGAFDHFKFFEPDQGQRLVIDLPGQWMLDSSLRTDIFVNHPWLSRIRLGKHPDFLRLVFQGQMEKMGSPKIQASDKMMTISLEPDA